MRHAADRHRCTCRPRKIAQEDHVDARARSAARDGGSAQDDGIDSILKLITALSAVAEG